MYKITDIKTVHLEITQKCQAACPMCDRNKNGGDINPHINLDELSISDCKKIFQPKFISQLKTMYMCGNLGDPIIAKDTLDIFRYFREHNSNIWLSMNTNGGARSSSWWNELARIFNKKGAVIFSIDGLKDTNHLYRQNVVWENVENSFKAFINAGGRARWDFLIFDHNQHQINEAEQLSKLIGFEKFIAKKTGRFLTATTHPKEEHQIESKKSNFILKKPKEEWVNSALKQQNKLVSNYGSMDNYYDSTAIKCKVKDEKSIFITAEGLALPCCWTAGRMYKWWHVNPQVEQIWNFIDQVGGKENLNAKYGLDKVFETGIFELIEKSWDKSSCEKGKLKVCSMKCGVEFDTFSSQYK